MRIFILFLLLGLLAAATIPVIETEDLGGTFHWKRLSVPSANTTITHAHTAFEYFFAYGSYGVPGNVKVLDVKLDNGLLTLNVSGDILHYEGSAFEHALVTQLIRIAAEVPDAERFTLIIDGIHQPLVKGTEIIALPLA